MKLGLLGFPVEHSLSPKLYRQLLGNQLTSYELFAYPTAAAVPELSFFAERLNGLNITSPYKTHFINEVTIPSPLVKKIGAVNTLAFTGQEVFATNTDILAVEEILKNYQNEYESLSLILLGDGVMAEVTKIVADSLELKYEQFSRKLTSNFSHLDLRNISTQKSQVLVINACSRDFIFQGAFAGDEIFWDYNYNFSPHKSRIPTLVKTYSDGQEMLERQAKAAIQFWKEVIPKLN